MVSGLFFHDDVPGGDCEKALVDYCGVPVEYNTTAPGDRAIFNATQAFNALNDVWQEAYGGCMKTIGQSYPTFLGISGFGCGGTSETTMCQRAAWQVVNEILYKAYPEEFYGLGACDGVACGYMK